MTGKMTPLLLTIIAIIFSTFHLQAQMSNETAWPRYRGADAAGRAENVQTSENWPETGLQLLWKKEFGDSFSEITLAQGKAFVLSSELTDSISGFEYLTALDAATGEQIWQTKLDSVFIDADNWGHRPRATPSTDGDKVFVFTGRGKLIALSTETGEIIWQRDAVKEFGSTIPRWGYASSPLLVDNMVISEIGGTDNRTIAAFDKDKGELLWAGGKGVSAYCSPLAATINEKLNILHVNSNILYSFDKKGDTLWTCKLPLSGPMAVPVFMAPDKLFISAVRSTGFCIVQAGKQGPEVILSGNSMKNDFSSSCYYKGYLYGFNVASLQCIDPTTGEKKWVKRGFGKGSLINIGDKLIILSDKGRLIYAEAQADSYKEISAFDALEGRCWTAPSFASGRLYVRNLTHVACYSFNN
jgi:outer membrane protein assembly factor BamB